MRGVTPQSLAATAALRDALRAAVADSAPSVAWSLPADVAEADFLAAVDRHRVFPLLARHGDRFNFPAALTAEVAAGDQAERLGSLLVTRHLIRAHQALADAGIRALAFKGPALAHQAYGDFTMRGTGDIDLLVSPDDLEAAYKTLEAAGWDGDTSMPRPGPSWAWRHLKRTCYEVSLRGPAMVDLHWHLVNIRGAFPPFNDLWEARTRVTLAGSMIDTLSPWDALAHSCAHAAKDDWSWLRSIADISALAANPATWQALSRPLPAIQLRSLGIAGICLGIPEGSPEIMRHAARGASGRWDRVQRRQAGQAINDRAGDFPGQAFIRGTTKAFRQSGSARSTALAAAAMIVPADYLGGIEATTFRKALPGLVANRRRSLGNAVERWNRTR